MFRLPVASRTARLVRAAGAVAVPLVLAAACTHSTAGKAAPQDGVSAAPGLVVVKVPGVDLSITDAVAHLDASGSGILTMTVRNGNGVPEHLDMVGTPGGGRGVLAGKSGEPGSGSMTGGGILFQPGSTVTFAGSGPSVRLAGVHGVTDERTLPLVLQFGVAGLVHLSAVVSS
ncbi:hypothetical protein [Streptomyces sp. NPDC049040]|uniref:hypothetical protein n=1 Tax=Streptomyces sp. NPDC049040 TaxID=3365593 RepID=UPI003718F024